MAQIRLAGVVPESTVDGPGIRYTVFVQGCRHNCEGCHNPQTHDFSGGYLTDTDALFDEMMADPLISGLTLSGGEPFEQAGALAELAERARAVGKDVMCYTGYTFEQLCGMAESRPEIMRLLRSADILVDGRFVLAERDLTLKFKGSGNQRTIDVKKSLEQGKAITFEFGD